MRGRRKTLADTKKKLAAEAATEGESTAAETKEAKLDPVDSDDTAMDVEKPKRGKRGRRKITIDMD